jgi:hypothetical protein
MIDLTGDWAISGAAYAITFDRLLDNSFRGRYININDPSMFVAQVFSSPRGTVVSMVQTHPEKDYYAVYSLRLSDVKTLQGSAADVESNAANFELVKQ